METIAVNENWDEATFYTSQMEGYKQRLAAESQIWDENDMRTIAGLVRIAEGDEAEKYLKKEEAADFMKVFEDAITKQADHADHALGFRVAENMLQFGYDDSEGWGLGRLTDEGIIDKGLTDERKKWCVDQLVGRLREIKDFDSEEGKTVLKNVGDIMSRSDPTTTFSTEIETFVTQKDLGEVVEFLDKHEETRTKMEKDKQERLGGMIDEFEAQKSGQDKS